MPFVAVCSTAEVPPGAMRRFDIAGRPLAVYNVDGAFFVTAAICTHEHADLTEGELQGRKITCPLHGARFDVATGRVVSPPAFKPLKTFAVRVRGDLLEVDLP